MHPCIVLSLTILDSTMQTCKTLHCLNVGDMTPATRALAQYGTIMTQSAAATPVERGVGALREGRGQRRLKEGFSAQAGKTGSLQWPTGQDAGQPVAEGGHARDVEDVVETGNTQ